MRTGKLKCGCTYTPGEREQWIALCPDHLKEWQETHGRWAAEHAAGQAEFNTPPLPEKPAPKRRRRS